jgi:Domain of unknown function (DUF1707)
MPGPGDEIAAAEGQRRSELRASHADRERVIEVLKAAFVQGRLAKDEFDLRVGQAFAARTHAELAAIAADLPAEPPTATEPAPAKPPVPACGQSEPPVVRPGRLIAVATVVCAGVWMFGFLVPWPRDSEGDPPHGVALLVYSTTLIYLFVLAMTLWLGGAVMVESWLKRRSGGQTPRRPAPGAGGQASGRPPSAGPGGELPPADHGQQHTTEAARSDPAHPRSPGSGSAHRGRHRGHRCTIGYAGN